eukprot:SAG11_NODE_30280_length_302_cov_1.014778_1_plen_82_part_10
MCLEVVPFTVTSCAKAYSSYVVLRKIGDQELEVFVVLSYGWRTGHDASWRTLSATIVVKRASRNHVTEGSSQFHGGFIVDSR